MRDRESQFVGCIGAIDYDQSFATISAYAAVEWAVFELCHKW
jgi:hypothetical protein